jgi:hypothetical protein
MVAFNDVRKRRWLQLLSIPHDLKTEKDGRGQIANVESKSRLSILSYLRTPSRFDNVVPLRVVCLVTDDRFLCTLVNPRGTGTIYLDKNRVDSNLSLIPPRWHAFFVVYLSGRNIHHDLQHRTLCE